MFVIRSKWQYVWSKRRNCTCVFLTGGIFCKLTCILVRDVFGIVLTYRQVRRVVHLIMAKRHKSLGLIKEAGYGLMDRGWVEIDGAVTFLRILFSTQFSNSLHILT